MNSSDDRHDFVLGFPATEGAAKSTFSMLPAGILLDGTFKRMAAAFR